MSNADEKNLRSAEDKPPKHCGSLKCTACNEEAERYEQRQGQRSEPAQRAGHCRRCGKTLDIEPEAAFCSYECLIAATPNSCPAQVMSGAAFDADPRAAYAAAQVAPLTITDSEGRPTMTVITPRDATEDGGEDRSVNRRSLPMLARQAHEAWTCESDSQTTRVAMQLLEAALDEMDRLASAKTSEPTRSAEEGTNMRAAENASTPVGLGMAGARPEENASEAGFAPPVEGAEGGSTPEDTSALADRAAKSAFDLREATIAECAKVVTDYANQLWEKGHKGESSHVHFARSLVERLAKARPT